MRLVVFAPTSLATKTFSALLVLAAAAVLLVGHLALNSLEQVATASSWAVANRVVVVDPGHGGRDPGAVGPHGVLEKDVTLAISRRLAEYLAQAGAITVLTRNSDQDLVVPGPGTMKKRDLDSRISLAKENLADLVVLIQANSFGSRWTGAQTFYQPDSPEGEALAKSIQARLITMMGNTQRVARPLQDAYMLRNLPMPAALVEVGFLSNPREEQLLSDPTYQSRLAYAIYTGVADYLAGSGAATGN